MQYQTCVCHYGCYNSNQINMEIRDILQERRESLLLELDAVEQALEELE